MYLFLPSMMMTMTMMMETNIFIISNTIILRDNFFDSKVIAFYMKWLAKQVNFKNYFIGAKEILSL